MNILRYFKKSAFGINTFGVRLDPNPVRISTNLDPGWFFGCRMSNGTSDTKGMKTKTRRSKLSKTLIQ